MGYLTVITRDSFRFIYIITLHPIHYAGLSSQYRTLQSEPELSDLQNEIATKIPNMWYAVGIQLKLTHNDLCSWLAESPSDTKKLFGHVFTAWKERGTRDYSWATMIEVLKTPSVCQPRLAEELAKKLNH